MCPSCLSRSDVEDTSERRCCEACGDVLVPETSVGEATIEDSDNSLVVELREAFGVRADGGEVVDSSSVATLWRRSKAAGRRADAEVLAVGTRLDDFEIVRELGRGGMGVVYRARQLSLGRDVALKVLPSHARHGRVSVQRFQTEAQAAARLNHANVVPVYAQGDFEGHYYYAMELIEGASLDSVMKTRPELLSSSGSHRSSSSSGSLYSRSARDAPVAEEPTGELTSHSTRGSLRRSPDDYCYIASLVAGVAEGLAHAHAHGVIHRDVKPHNLIFGSDNQLHITDFGLAQLADEPHLTITGEVMGTPSYISPEQASGKVGAISELTDIYSLGVTLYELITEQRPFVGETRQQIIDAVLNQEPKRPRRLEKCIPVDLETICLRAIDKDPRRRYSSAAAMAEDLRRFADGRPILSRRVGAAEKAIRWVRRHKAIATAAAATFALLTVSTGWAASTAAKNRRHGNALIQTAYDSLVHSDFARTKEVMSALDEAETLGADDPRGELIRAIGSIARADADAAIARLEALLEEDPDNLEALYILAWAQRRQGRSDKALGIIERADALGGAETAEEWFFRAFALRRDDPREAIESFRTASTMQSADNKFFPQADLKLALADNQLMYETRSLETFDEAEAILRNLIRLGHYRGYPYYLLAITYRLAGEIHLYGPGERDRDKADDLFALALDRAREGRELYPDDNRLMTTSAMCLERMGLLEGALVARDRAVELARTAGLDDQLRENLHFRWRLNYLLGNYDDALRDIETHAALLADAAGSAQASRFRLLYTHLFPALVYADMGELETALDLVREAGTRSSSSADPQAVMLSAAFLRILGRPGEAAALLADSDRQVALDYTLGIRTHQSVQWLRNLYAYAVGNFDLDGLRGLAGDSSDGRRLMGEAYFHGGTKALAAGDRYDARNYFERAFLSFNGVREHSFLGRIMLGRLAGDSNWPAWIPTAGEGAPEAPSLDVR